MTTEQERLVLEIVSRMGEDAYQGVWPHQECLYCGYADSHDFTHEEWCIVPLCKRLRETLRFPLTREEWEGDDLV